MRYACIVMCDLHTSARFVPLDQCVQRRGDMPVVLNHMIVPAMDKNAAARFFADLLGLPVSETAGPFAPVKVNDDLSLDFADRHRAEPGHYAFLVDDETFDALLGRLRRDSTIDYGSGPQNG